MHFLNYMDLFNNLQILTPHNKMEFQNKKNTLMKFSINIL
jgi:hypothetical protein